MISRRNFIKSGMAASAAISAGVVPLYPSPGKKIPICIFSKHLHWLDFTEMARYAKNLGFDGIDLTVRRGGHVPPEKVEDLLPRAIEEITKVGMEVPMMATNINDPEDPLTKKVLKTAGENGIRFYRMAYYRFKGEEKLTKQDIAHPWRCW